MPPRRPLVRIEQGPNNTLSLAAVRSELTRKSKPKDFTAFSFKSFATSSFEECMAADGHEHADAPDADVIDHAVSQITLRTTLVTQMTSEVRKESAAALAAAQAEMGGTGVAVARKRPAEEAQPAAQSQSQHEAERAAVEALAKTWRASLERLARRAPLRARASFVPSADTRSVGAAFCGDLLLHHAQV